MPAYLFVSGLILILASAALAVRLIWEMTALTWREGPQMVGFALSHLLGALPFLAPAGLVCWLVAMFVVILVRLLRRKPVIRTVWMMFALGLVVVVVLALPQGFWDRVFVDRLVNSPKAGELLVTAAGEGELAP